MTNKTNDAKSRSARAPRSTHDLYQSCPRSSWESCCVTACSKLRTPPRCPSSFWRTKGLLRIKRPTSSSTGMHSRTASVAMCVFCCNYYRFYKKKLCTQKPQIPVEVSTCLSLCSVATHNSVGPGWKLKKTVVRRYIFACFFFFSVICFDRKCFRGGSKRGILFPLLGSETPLRRIVRGQRTPLCIVDVCLR